MYYTHSNPVAIEDRRAGDLIFLHSTYDTDLPISHVGIFMGELTIGNRTTEWVIDTGSNPRGVKITEYANGWWNGPNFYAFGRLRMLDDR